MRAGKRVIAPFDAKALFLSAEDELTCARIWAADQHAGPPASSFAARQERAIYNPRRLYLCGFP